MYTHYNHCHRATAHLQLNIIIIKIQYGKMQNFNVTPEVVHSYH